MASTTAHEPNANGLKPVADPSLVGTREATFGVFARAAGLVGAGVAIALLLLAVVLL